MPEDNKLPFHISQAPESLTLTAPTTPLEHSAAPLYTRSTINKALAPTVLHYPGSYTRVNIPESRLQTVPSHAKDAQEELAQMELTDQVRRAMMRLLKLQLYISRDTTFFNELGGALANGTSTLVSAVEKMHASNADRRRIAFWTERVNRPHFNHQAKRLEQPRKPIDSDLNGTFGEFTFSTELEIPLTTRFIAEILLQQYRNFTQIRRQMVEKNHQADCMFVPINDNYWIILKNGATFLKFPIASKWLEKALAAPSATQSVLLIEQLLTHTLQSQQNQWQVMDIQKVNRSTRAGFAGTRAIQDAPIADPSAFDAAHICLTFTPLPENTSISSIQPFNASAHTSGGAIAASYTCYMANGRLSKLAVNNPHPLIDGKAGWDEFERLKIALKKSENTSFNTRDPEQNSEIAKLTHPAPTPEYLTQPSHEQIRLREATFPKLSSEEKAKLAAFAKKIKTDTAYAQIALNETTLLFFAVLLTLKSSHGHFLELDAQDLSVVPAIGVLRQELAQKIRDGKKLDLIEHAELLEVITDLSIERTECMAGYGIVKTLSSFTSAKKRQILQKVGAFLDNKRIGMLLDTDQVSILRQAEGFTPALSEIHKRAAAISSTEDDLHWKAVLKTRTAGKEDVPDFSEEIGKNFRLLFNALIPT